MSQKELLGVDKIPQLNKNMSIDDAIRLLVPASFSDIVHVKADIDGIILTFAKAEDGNKEIKIPAKIFNPESKSVVFPQFILQISEFAKQKLDYANGKEKIFARNQNEILWLALHHRFTRFRDQNVHYTHLVREDIQRISDYGEYASYASINARRKADHYVAIICCWKYLGGSKFCYEQDSKGAERCIGELIRPTQLTEKQLNALARDLCIQPASESMASETSKFVVYSYESKSPLYTAAGFGYLLKKDPNTGKPYLAFRSIFPTKSNIPARFKSHIVSDAFMFSNPDDAIFSEDIINKKTMQTDGTMKNAVVVFAPMDAKTGHFLCGEIEASSKFSSELVYKDEIIRECFKVIKVKEGDELKGPRIVIGINAEDEEECLVNFKSVQIISIEETGMNDGYKIIARCMKQIGSSRIHSHTGLKGVTKPKPSLGHITVKDASGEMVKYNVDLVTGMNAVKAKSNTIMLAKAALAFKLGYAGDLPYLTSMNAKQINEIANSIDLVDWVDEYGNEHKVLAGIVPTCISELSYMYNNVRDQNFMDVSGRYLSHGGHEELRDLIWHQGVYPDTKDAVLEMQKIIQDSVGYYANTEDLPVYTPAQLQKMKVFKESDIKLELRPMYQHKSKLLDEAANKGWYLDLRHRNGGMVRMPSARLLNYFVDKLPSGEWTYPMTLRNVSKIIQACIVLNERGMANVGFLNDAKGENKNRLVDYYLREIRNRLHAGQNMAQVFLKPKIRGVGMKQMTDIHVPKGTVVILDDRAFGSLFRKAFGHDAEFKRDKPTSFRALCVRNPVVWKSQVQSVRVWNAAGFKDYLSDAVGIDLNDYLTVKFCREILLMNPEDAILSQSDVDGDLMPVFVPEGQKAQELLSQFNRVPNTDDIWGVDGIVPEEIQWIKAYRDGELSANKDLSVDNGYVLYDLPVSHSPDNSHTFMKFYIDSIIAKGDVGPATFNNWALSDLLEVYKAKCENGTIDLDPNGKARKISQEEINYILYAYSRLVQDLVIRGIKHNLGGSSGFRPFLLINMVDSTYIKQVYKHLKDVVGLRKDIISKMFDVIHWGSKDTEMTKNITQFLALYNSGKEPRNGFDPELYKNIRGYTFHGFLMDEFCKVREKVEAAVLAGFTYVSKSGGANGGGYSNGHYGNAQAAVSSADLYASFDGFGSGGQGSAMHVSARKADKFDKLVKLVNEIMG